MKPVAGAGKFRRRDVAITQRDFRIAFVYNTYSAAGLSDIFFPLGIEW
jgi:hypothetical protein